MGLFGDKKQKKSTKPKEEALGLDLRWDKYYINKSIKIDDLGEIEFISKSLLRLKTDKKTDLIQEGLTIPVKINGKEYKCLVLEIAEGKIDLAFKEEFEDIEFIKENTRFIESYKTSKKYTITDKEIEGIKISQDFINAINLLSEVDDPDADAESLSFIINQIPPLKNKIIEEANKASENVIEEIKDLPTAIARLGMDKIKKLSYQYFDLFVATYKNPMENFESFNQFNITKVQAFKKFAPYIPFQPKRKLGLLLLLLENVSSIANLFVEKDSNYKSILKNALKFYSYPLRIYEKYLFGEDYLSLNGRFLERKFKILLEVNDSYKLAHLLLNPMLSLKQEPLNLSNRNLKRAYLYYLVFLAVNFLVYNDKKSGFILYNRLKRFGMSVNESTDFLNEIVFYVNKILTALKIKPYLRTPSPANYTISCKKNFPESGDFIDLIETFKKLGSGKFKRLALRHQDSKFAGLLLNYLINDPEIGLHDKSFIIIPSEEIQNPDSLLIENLAGFDIVYFKNIDNLSPVIYREFYKIWKNFEGIIIADYSYYSFIDFDPTKIQIFHIIKENKIDIPLLTENQKAYDFLKEQAKNMYIELFEKTDFKNLDKIESNLYDLESAFLMLLD